MTDTLSSIGTHLHKKDRFDISLFLALSCWDSSVS